MSNVTKLFTAYRKELASVLRKRGASADLAADITQETFLRALSRPSDNEIDNPRAFLHRIANNLFVDSRRRSSRQANTDLSNREWSRLVDPAPSAETIVADRQDIMAVQKALAAMPDRTRRAFEMHRLEAMTIAAVAADLGLSTTRTWALIREAYSLIREELAK